MKKSYYFLFLLIFLFTPFISKAYVTKSSDFIYIAKDEVIEGNFYFMAKSLTIEGEILGDVVGIGPNIQINGKVAGDVIVISQNLKITGQVEGNLRSISNTTDISGVIEKNINILGESLILNENSKAGKDVLFQTLNAEFNGEIEGSLHGGANNILIRGLIKENSNLTLDRIKRKKYYNILQIEESAEILGNLNYKGGQNAKINTDKISGEINKKEPLKNNSSSKKASKVLFTVLSSFLVAILLSLLFKNKLNNIKNIIIEQGYKLSLPGVIILFLTPIIALLLVITFVGMPIAIIILIFWGLVIYLSKIIVAMALGEYIFKYFQKEKVSEFLKILTGVILISIITIIPFLGGVLSLLIISLGMGLVYYIIKNKKYAN